MRPSRITFAPIVVDAAAAMGLLAAVKERQLRLREMLAQRDKAASERAKAAAALALTFTSFTTMTAERDAAAAALAALTVSLTTMTVGRDAFRLCLKDAGRRVRCRVLCSMRRGSKRAESPTPPTHRAQ